MGTSRSAVSVEKHDIALREERERGGGGGGGREGEEREGEREPDRQTDRQAGREHFFQRGQGLPKKCSDTSIRQRQ